MARQWQSVSITAFRASTCKIYILYIYVRNGRNENEKRWQRMSSLEALAEAVCSQVWWSSTLPRKRKPLYFSISFPLNLGTNSLCPKEFIESSSVCSCTWFQGLGLFQLASVIGRGKASNERLLQAFPSISIWWWQCPNQVSMPLVFI